MSNYIHTDIKIKQQNGTFLKYSPTVTLDSILVDNDDNSIKLSELLTNNGANYSGTAANASAVSWSGITGKPTTLSGYGITDGAKSSDLTSHTNNKSNPHGVTKSQVGLGNVDNTSDANKPISTATQTALNAKQATITGAATTVTSSNLTASRALLSNADGKIAVSDVTSTELGYLDGVTSNIQTQLGNKVNTSDVVTTATADKILKLDSSGKLPASVIAGVLSIDNIPAGALERCVVVANDTARFSLTSAQVQTGDTVKVTDTGIMYFVKDSANLDDETGYEIYTAGSATSVPWSGVTSKPTTLSGYGITDAATSSSLSSHTENKSNPHGVTKSQVGLGNVDNTSDANKPISTATQTALNAKQATITGGASTITSSNLTVSRALVSNASGKVAVSDVTSTELGYLDGVTSNIQTQLGNKVNTSDVVTTATADKILKLNVDGVLPASITGNAATATTAGSASSVAWSGVTDKPTTLNGYGITDAATSSSLSSHTGNKSNPHSVTKSQVGLGNVDNTSDANKPISTATQTALNAKQATITGAATTITSSNLTASRALLSNADGKIAVSAVTSTELGYLDGVTSNIQTQFGNKVNTSDVVTTPAANKILKLDSTGKFPVASLPQHIEFTTYTLADIS